MRGTEASPHLPTLASWPLEEACTLQAAIFEDIDAQRTGGDGRLSPSAGTAMELMPASGAAELFLRRAATTQRNWDSAPQTDRLTVHHSSFSLGDAGLISAVSASLHPGSACAAARDVHDTAGARPFLIIGAGRACRA